MDTHSIPSSTVTLDLHASAPPPHRLCSTASTFHKSNLPVDTRLHIYSIHDMHFSKICHFRHMIQSNSIKTKISDSFSTQSSLTQPVSKRNPQTTPIHIIVTVCLRTLGELSAPQHCVTGIRKQP